MKQSFQILKGLKHVFIFVTFIIGAFLFGEVHPFSMFPMYNSFPNWSYAFYITDENDRMIYFENSEMKAGKLAHIFYSVCTYKKIPFGNNMETNQQLHDVGNQMIKQLVTDDSTFTAQYRIIRLYRIFYHYRNNKIVEQRQMMYERKIR